MIIYYKCPVWKLSPILLLLQLPLPFGDRNVGYGVRCCFVILSLPIIFICGGVTQFAQLLLSSVLFYQIIRSTCYFDSPKMCFVRLFHQAVFHFGENVDLFVAGSIILKEYEYFYIFV